jgi:hypothetical protein
VVVQEVLTLIRLIAQILPMAGTDAEVPGQTFRWLCERPSAGACAEPIWALGEQSRSDTAAFSVAGLPGVRR